jgi:hypothetical protein
VPNKIALRIVMQVLVKGVHHVQFMYDNVHGPCVKNIRIPKLAMLFASLRDYVCGMVVFDNMRHSLIIINDIMIIIIASYQRNK